MRCVQLIVVLYKLFSFCCIIMGTDGKIPFSLHVPEIVTTQLLPACCVVDVDFGAP